MTRSRSTSAVPADPRRHRLTFRARLAITYAGLLTVSGAVLLALMAFFIVWYPNYAFTPTAPTIPSIPDGTHSATPLEAGVVQDVSVAGIPATVSSRDDLLQLVLVVGATLLLVVALLGAVIGWRLAGRMLTPLHEVSAAARRAAAGHLDHRIALGPTRDEVTELANTFDDMLGSLEASFHAHQRFAANASHELRTPLATSRALLDVALASGDAPARELLRDLRRMNERSIDTVDALLGLADVEAPHGPDELCDLRRIAQASVDMALPQSEREGISVETDLQPATAWGDPRLIRTLADNLILNAVIHNVQDGTVRVRTATIAGGAALVIENSGPHLPPETSQQLSEPFFRSRGRTAAAGGHGLGLAIVAAIARRHHARLELTPREEGGLSATVVFPPNDV